MQRHRKPVQVSDVQRAKVRVEGIVQQALVYREVDWRVVLWASRGRWTTLCT